MNVDHVLIELLALAVGRPVPCACNGGYRHFVKRLNVDAIPDRRWLEFMHDYTQAVRFPSMATALAAYLAQSRTIPLNPRNGRPSRPLTAFAVEFVRDDLLAEEAV
jgi:hypothetical protein